MKTRITLDVECYRNYFLIKFQSRDGKTRNYELYEGQPLNVMEVRGILQTYTIVSFNGNGYDLPMVLLALRGADNEELKAASDWIILGEKTSWEFYDHYGIPRPDWIDHIDLIEVAPGQASLKLYGGRLHSRKLQDLPIAPDALISPEERQLLIDYCGNDHQTTWDLADHLAPQIELRESMSLEYGIDLRSKSDAQIAEAVIRSKVSKLLGGKVTRPEIPPGTRFKYVPPKFLSFTTPALKNILRNLEITDFVIDKTGAPMLPVELDGAVVRIGAGEYRMGIGGLHSSETKTAHIADDETLLIDRDVNSYYPAIVLNCGLFPKHLTEAFLTVYRGLVETRLKAKKAKNTVVANALKITINGSFGKLGSKYSALYSPNLLIQVTVTGQLSLLMLIERIEGAGIPVVSANTDGIVIKCPKSRYDDLAQIIKWWETTTGFETEETRYKALFSRDVNNYIALKENGGNKGKGAYAEPSIAKNPQNTICVDAVKAFIEHGTPIAETIIRCRDIRKFVTVRTVKGGAIRITRSNYDTSLRPSQMREVLLANGWHQVEPGPLSKARFTYMVGEPDYDVETAYRQHCGEDDYEYIGKVVRWYYANGVTDSLYYRAKNTKGNRNAVPSSDGAMPLMDLPDEFPIDVDYGRYIQIANEMLIDIGVMK
jgi:hypothetical protein